MTRFGWMVIAVAGGFAVVIGLAAAGTGVTFVRAIFVGVNMATMLAYGYDKHVAQARGRRVPEAALHVMAAAGGTPGAFLGRVAFRHKICKRRFLLVFWAIAVVQAAGLLIWLHPRNG